MKVSVHFKAGPYLPLTETWIYSQIQHLAFYRPVVYALETMNLDLFPTKTVRRLDTNERYRHFSRPIFYGKFLFYMARDKPSLVHAHFGPSGYAFLRIKRLLKTPLITSFYGYDLHKLVKEHPEWGERYKELFRLGDLFLVEGTHMKNSLTGLGCPGEKIVVQHLGIDHSLLPIVIRTKEDGEPIRILIAASFREKKGIVYAVRAFGELTRRLGKSGLRLTIIGDSSGDPHGENEKRAILDTINEYDLSGSVTLMGYQPHHVFVSELYKNHIFLSPSVHASDGDTEGGVPVTVIEASASGMPVVSTTHCDIPEAILNERTGYLVPERDVDALVDRLEFLALNHESWREIGRKGKQHTADNYDIRTQGRKLEGIYDGIAR